MTAQNEVVLPDGTRAQVDDRTAGSIKQLYALVIELARGEVSTLAAARVRRDSSRVSGMITYFDGQLEKLTALDKGLRDLGDICEQEIAKWQGNAPPNNRSWMLQ